MIDHIDAIEKSIENENYYSAVFLTLMLPSICGALESDDGRDSGARYIDWYKKYVTNLAMSGDDCYLLRCSLLHQASTIHPASTFQRVIFTYPIPSGNTLHNNVMNDALNLDIPRFCTEIIAGARQWLKDVSSNPNYIRNSANMIRKYPDGLLPYIKGHPVIS